MKPDNVKYNPTEHKREQIYTVIHSLWLSQAVPWEPYIASVVQAIKETGSRASELSIGCAQCEGYKPKIYVERCRLESDDELTTRLGPVIGRRVILEEQMTHNAKLKAEYTADMGELVKLRDKQRAIEAKWQHRKVPYDGPDSI